MLRTRPIRQDLSRKERIVATCIVAAALLGALLLGVLAAEGVARAQAKARAQIARFKTGLQLYMVDIGQAPTTQQGLDALIHQPGSMPNWKKYLPELSAIPNDPWGRPHVYESPGRNGDDYFIASYGADGRSGGFWAAADCTSVDPP